MNSKPLGGNAFRGGSLARDARELSSTLAPTSDGLRPNSYRAATALHETFDRFSTSGCSADISWPLRVQDAAVPDVAVAEPDAAAEPYVRPEALDAAAVVLALEAAVEQASPAVPAWAAARPVAFPASAVLAAGKLASET